MSENNVIDLDQYRVGQRLRVVLEGEVELATDQDFDGDLTFKVDGGVGNTYLRPGMEGLKSIEDITPAREPQDGDTYTNGYGTWLLVPGGYVHIAGASKGQHFRYSGDRNHVRTFGKGSASRLIATDYNRVEVTA